MKNNCIQIFRSRGVDFFKPWWRDLDLKVELSDYFFLSPSISVRTKLNYNCFVVTNMYSSEGKRILILKIIKLKVWLMFFSNVDIIKKRKIQPEHQTHSDSHLVMYGRVVRVTFWCFWFPQFVLFWRAGWYHWISLRTNYWYRSKGYRAIYRENAYANQCSQNT